MMTSLRGRFQNIYPFLGGLNLSHLQGDLQLSGPSFCFHITLTQISLLMKKRHLPSSHNTHSLTHSLISGAVVVSSGGCDLVTCTGLTDLAVLHVDSESDLLEEVVRLVTTWDPDMLVGYEVGYYTQAQHHVSFLSVLLLCALLCLRILCLSFCSFY